MSGLESLLEQTRAKAELQLCCWGHGGCCPGRGHSEGLLAQRSWGRGAAVGWGPSCQCVLRAVGCCHRWDGDPFLCRECCTRKKKQPAGQWRTCGLGMHGREKVEQEGWCVPSWWGSDRPWWPLGQRWAWVWSPLAEQENSLALNSLGHALKLWNSWSCVLVFLHMCFLCLLLQCCTSTSHWSQFAFLAVWGLIFKLLERITEVWYVKAVHSCSF